MAASPHHARRSLVAVLAGVVGALLLAVAAACSTSAGPASPSTPTFAALIHPARELPAEAGPGRAPVAPPRDRALTAADGLLPDGASVFDDQLAGVARLDPDLLAALRTAAREAAGDGVDLSLNSGWRSPAYQDRLLHEAVARYGSETEAARWVATRETSRHVFGDAVDVGPPKAAAWLADHGARFGLCRVYGNEPWHFELRPQARRDGCPATYPDPTQDPRLRTG